MPQIVCQYIREVDDSFGRAAAEVRAAELVVFGRITVGRLAIHGGHSRAILSLAHRDLPTGQPAEDFARRKPALNPLPQHALDHIQMLPLRAEDAVRLYELPGMLHRLA